METQTEHKANTLSPVGRNKLINESSTSELISEKCDLQSTHKGKQQSGHSVTNALKTTSLVLLFCPQAAV